MSNYVTVTQYAELLGVTRAAIYYRIDKGLIKAVKFPNRTGTDYAYMIDIKQYPPVGMNRGRKPFIAAERP